MIARYFGRWTLNAVFHIFSVFVVIGLCWLVMQARRREADLREWVLDASGLRRRVRVMKREEFLSSFAKSLNIPAVLEFAPDDGIVKPMRAATLIHLVIGGRLQAINWDGKSQRLVIELGVPIDDVQGMTTRLKQELSLDARGTVSLTTGKSSDKFKGNGGQA